MSRFGRGFTLLELMIAAAIISILAAIAYPAYQEHVTRSYRSEALVLMQDVGAALEDYALNNDDYSGATLAGVYTLDADRHPAVGRYDFNLSNSASSWTLTATPKGPQAGDGKLILYSDGRQGWDQDGDGTYEPLSL